MLFVKFTTTHKEFGLWKYSKILSELDLSADLVCNIHAKKVVDQFYSKDEKETASRQQKQKTKKEQEGRRPEPKEKNAKPRVDESKEKTTEEARRKDWDIYWRCAKTWQALFKRSCVIWKRKEIAKFE